MTGRSPVRLALAVVCAVGAAAAQSATVSNTADTGAGSLRAALTAANASAAPSFTIDVTAAATTAPIVLATVLPPLSRSNVLVRAVGGAGRLVVDARPATVGAGFGFEASGDDVVFAVPCRFHVTDGNGVVVRGDRTAFADLQVVGVAGGHGLVTVPGADALVLDRFDARGFQQGLFLNGGFAARVADAAAGVAVVQDNLGAGIRVAGGGDHTIGLVVAAGNGIGIAADGAPGLSIGRPGGPRSLVVLNDDQGIVATQCPGLTVREVDVLANGGGGTGGYGVQVIGGADVVVRDVHAEANAFGGVALQGGVDTVRIGPNVTTRGVGGAVDRGLAVFDATRVTVFACAFGPDHGVGAVLAPAGGGAPAHVAFADCVFAGNRSVGLSVLRSDDTLVTACAFAGNLGDGIQAVGPNLAGGPRDLRVFDSWIGGNGGSGVFGQAVDGLVVGAGTHVVDNVISGVRAFGSVGVVVEDVAAIAGNRASGVWLADCTGAVVRRARLLGNRGRGIYALRCTAMSIGPDVEVRDTIGTGLQWELTDDSVMFASRIVGNSAHGVHVLDALGTPGSQPLRLQSCLVAGHAGLAVYHTGTPLLRCEQCTISGNLRGIVSGGSPTEVDSCIVRDNLLEDLQANATAMLVRHTFYLLPPPAVGSSNTAADPRFVAPAVGDWRLQANSPAVGAADPALAVAPGALDAFGGPRAVGALDAGCHEVGPPPPAPLPRLVLSSATMAHGGGGLAFRLEYPTPAAVGTVSVLFAELGPPSGSFPLFGGIVPLAPTPALLLVANHPDTVNGIAVVPTDGVVTGALLFGGALSPSTTNQVVSLCGVALDPSLVVRAVTDVASFTIL